MKTKRIKKLLIILGLKKNFTKRISKTLDVFTTAKNDLLQLNEEINSAKIKNAKKISALAIENKAHEDALLSNANVISNISLLLGVK